MTQENRNIYSYLARRKTVISPDSGLVIPNAPIPITSISIQPNYLSWNYGVFVSDETFNNWGEPVKDFTIGYALYGSEVSDFYAANQVLMSDLTTRLKIPCYPAPTENATLRYANFEPTNWKLSIKFDDGNRPPRVELFNEDYLNLINAHMDVIGYQKDEQGNITGLGLIPLLDAVSVQKAPDFWQDAVLIQPE